MARRIYKRGYLKDLDLWALHNHGFPFWGLEDPQKLGNLSPALRGWSLEAFWNNGFFKNIFWVLTTFIYAILSNTLFKIRRQWQSHKMSNHFITNILDKIFFIFLNWTSQDEKAASNNGHAMLLMFHPNVTLANISTVFCIFVKYFNFLVLHSVRRNFNIFAHSKFFNISTFYFGCRSSAHWRIFNVSALLYANISNFHFCTI